ASESNILCPICKNNNLKNFPNSSAIITSSFAISVTNAISITNASNSATPVTNTSNSAVPVINTSNPITHTTSNNPATNIITTSNNPATYIASNSSKFANNFSIPTNFNNPTRSTTYINEILENSRISINKAKSTAYNEILAKNSHLTKDSLK
ncbi:15141_t:CDS:2, partial [Racocetra fulgida]